MRAGICLAGVLLALVLALPGEAAQGGFVRIAATGDIAMAPAADGGAGFFSGVGLDLTGDVVFGNLEGTLAGGGSSRCKPSSTDCYAFRAPPSYAGLLRRAGFTILNLANNHALDYGAEGQAETLAALDRAGLRHTGRPGEVAYLRAGRTRVAVLGFAPYPWAQDLLDIPAARELVTAAAARADVLIVTMHAGAEGARHQHVRRGPEFFLGENRGNAIAFTHAVVDAGADLVLGSGPHVLRGLEWYRDRLVAYSLGNFLGAGTLSIKGPSGVSAILQVGLNADGSWAGGLLVPLRLVPPGVPVEDPKNRALATVRRLSLQDFGVRGMRISRDGILLPPG